MRKNTEIEKPYMYLYVSIRHCPPTVDTGGQLLIINETPPIKENGTGIIFIGITPDIGAGEQGPAFDNAITGRTHE